MKDWSYLRFDVISLAPLELGGRCGEICFTLEEYKGGFKLIGSDGSDYWCHSLKDAFQHCYLNWG